MGGAPARRRRVSRSRHDLAGHSDAGADPQRFAQLAAGAHDHHRWPPTRGAEGVLVAHGDQGGGYSVKVRHGRLAFVHNDGHGTTAAHDAGALSVGRHTVVVSVGAPGGRRWTVSVMVDGAPAGESVDCTMMWPIAPFSGIDVGIDRGSPIDWQRYEHEGSCAYTATLHSVRYEPGEMTPDAPVTSTDFLREWGAKFE